MSERIEVHAEWHGVRFLNCELPLPPHGSGVKKTGLIFDGLEYPEVAPGVWSGPVGVTVESRSSQPEEVEGLWEDVAEFLAIVTDGPLVLGGIWETPMPDWPRLDGFGPGTYRIRVHARGRDIAYDGAVSEATEEYLLVSWPEKESRPASLMALTSRAGKSVLGAERARQGRSMRDGARGGLMPAAPVPTGPPHPPIRILMRDQEGDPDSTTSKSQPQSPTPSVERASAVLSRCSRRHPPASTGTYPASGRLCRRR